MSVATEITRLQTAKADIKAAIEAKGVTVPSSAKIDVYDDYIAQISTGKRYDDVTPGIYAYYPDGTLKTYNEADANAIGVAVISVETKFVMYKRAFDTNISYFNITDADIANYGISAPVYPDDVIFTDYNGFKNTYNLRRYLKTLGSTYNEKYVDEAMLRFGHLLSSGQLFIATQNKSDINSMMSKIGGYASFDGATCTLYRNSKSGPYTMTAAWSDFWNDGSTWIPATCAFTNSRTVPLAITLDYDYENMVAL